MGIFFFPIIFQSVHMVWHLTSGQKHPPGPACCTIHKQDSGKDVESLEQKNVRCPVCKYQFTLTTLPDHPVFKAIIPVQEGLGEEIKTEPPQRPIFTFKSPRAPPFPAFC